MGFYHSARSIREPICNWVGAGREILNKELISVVPRAKRLLLVTRVNDLNGDACVAASCETIKLYSAAI